MFGRLKNWLKSQRKHEQYQPAAAPAPPPPPPEFAVGDRVSVRLNERNHTPHVGEIQRVTWHHKDARYNYYLSENNKRVHKRYFAEDLERVERGEKLNAPS